ncbi:methyl-accepting chemotaxis protein [Crateriforma conspicua]|uniref:Biofilm dispersion protein BdlA n=1 Tax=Crateriforma conspicua TaxID=2527996 RepID=A0A5C6FKE5_9PLAN|nr:PAS domain-containing methyl-accepting chemotaxis protein [Crateriforma conspicua]TWU62457.1 Biofilm dispersion protein BdlA [Crateriforma conspicua]
MKLLNWSNGASENVSQADMMDSTTATLDIDADQFVDLSQIMSSLHRSQAVIEFEPDGTILKANKNFLDTVGYTLSEIQGKHHRMFVDSEYAGSEEYRQFWEKLRAGNFHSDLFQRYGRGGREIWIQATYNPVLNDSGQVIKIIKLATDVTKARMIQADIQNRSQAMIEFKPDGTILHANSLFLQTTGYSLEEIRGKHHRMFMPAEDAATAEYARFWERLARGEFQQGEFRRVNKHGQEIWLSGAYNPVFDNDGNVTRVVKNVSDITDQVHSKNQSESLGNSIASSVSEMSQAIAEISERITRTAGLAKDADVNTKNATDLVKDLNCSSETIGEIIDTIQDLADQTNLLALNATIEAARAGESGRGFAVVASEVKELANQTGKATSEIRKNVETIQFSIGQVVSAIECIANSVGEVSDNTTGVAASVEEQNVVISQLSSAADELVGCSS